MELLEAQVTPVLSPELAHLCLTLFLGQASLSISVSNSQIQENVVSLPVQDPLPSDRAGCTDGSAVKSICLEEDLS